MTISERDVLHIDDFDFKNGQPIKGRFLIVLSDDENSQIILSIVTSQDFVPVDLFKHGCIKEDERRIHCYCFEEKNIIGINNDFSFKKNSFIYIDQSSVYEASISNITDAYKDKIDIKDSLLETEYIDLIYCIYKNKFIERGIKRKLNDILEKLLS
jgi:hypothetical protein